MLDNARGRKIQELTFPGGNRVARRWCRHTARPKPRLEMGLHKERLIANRADRFTDLLGKRQQPGLVPLNLRGLP